MGDCSTHEHENLYLLGQTNHLSKDAISLNLSGDGAYIRERLVYPEACDPDSFRTKAQPNGHKLLLCCPRGQWRGSSCNRTQVAQSRLHPRSEQDMLLREAAQRGVPVISQQQGQPSLDEQLIEADVQEMIQRVLKEATAK